MPPLADLRECEHRRATPCVDRNGTCGTHLSPWAEAALPVPALSDEGIEWLLARIEETRTSYNEVLARHPNDPILRELRWAIGHATLAAEVAANARAALPVPALDALRALDLRCENYVGSDHRPRFDGCPANGRQRDGEFTADRWCLPCEARAALGSQEDVK